MQAAKSTMAAVKETAANLGASAQSGMEKTMATLQEKVEKMTAQHPAEKEMAEGKKQERIQEADIHKRQAMKHNAAVATEKIRAGHTSGPDGLAASPVPGQGRATEGVAGSHPTGTARPSASHNPHAEGTEPALRGTGSP